MTEKKGNEIKDRKIDLDFISRNWLLLTKLYRKGYSVERSKRIARSIESGHMTLRDLE